MERSASLKGAATQKGLWESWSENAFCKEITKGYMCQGMGKGNTETWMKMGARGRPKNLARVCQCFWKWTIILSGWTYQNWSLAKIICHEILPVHLANVDWMSVTCQTVRTQCCQAKAMLRLSSMTRNLDFYSKCNRKQLESIKQMVVMNWLI